MKFSGSFDTNAILRLLLDDLPHQHEAVKNLLNKVINQFVVADTAIIELVFVLERHYCFSRQQVAEAIMGFMQIKEINCNRKLFEKALLIYQGYPALSFEDCCLSIYAILNEAQPLWTFDKKLAIQSPSARLIQV